MDRRNFFKIIGATGAGAVSTACGPSTDALIPMLVPEGQIVPGVEQWHPAVCGECAAGCGTLVRVMEGRRVIEAAVVQAAPDEDGQMIASETGETERVRQRIAAVKKIEGNPLDPVSGGRLCARGQAVVQSLYNPDRLQGPKRLAGVRGSGEFADAAWDEVIAEAAQAIAAAGPEGVVVLTGAQAGTRSVAWQRFTEALGAPAPVVCALDGHAVELEAARRVFGWDGLPVYDLARASTVLSVGADFLGGWTSPVYYARQFGEFRQGRAEIRGTLFHAESRLSTTAATADRWLPVRPGTEPLLLGAVGKILLEEDPERGLGLPEQVRAAFEEIDIAAAVEACGLEEHRVREAADSLSGAIAPMVIGGASVVHANSVDAIAASHYLNVMLGSVEWPGGLLAPVEPVTSAIPDHRIADALARARVVLIDNANPAYILPLSSGAQGALTNADFVISFASFLDDSAAYADLILPAHHYLEAETALVPAVARGMGLAINTPFVRPLYNTRPVEESLAAIAGAMDLEYNAPSGQDLAAELTTEALPYSEIARQGGAWIEPAPIGDLPVVELLDNSIDLAALPEADAAYPLQFQPYMSLKFHDGRGSNLPWMQELPDPVSSAMWQVPVEVDPRTAEELGIRDGDHIQIESEHGSIEAPAYVHPGAIPGVVSMAIGDGHMHYGRYTAGRGANPLSILAPAFEESTGALVTGGTRVKLARLGSGRLTQYSFQNTEDRDTERY